MKLVGKKVERMNKYGDTSCINLTDNGRMRLSPNLVSRLRITKNTNRIGFAYPESNEEHTYVYLAPDNNGIAINAQGYATNKPHNRDLRSTFGLSSTGECTLYVDETPVTYPEYEGYTFYRLTASAEDTEVTSTSVEDTREGEDWTDTTETSAAITTEESTVEEVETEEVAFDDIF